MTVPDFAHAIAETRLTEQCTIRAVGVDDVDSGGAITRTPGPLVWSGACSLDATKDTPVSTAGGDERRVPTRTLRLPPAAHGHLGDQVTVEGRTGTFTIIQLDDRPDPVLRRFRVVNTVDAPGVPV